MSKKVQKDRALIDNDYLATENRPRGSYTNNESRHSHGFTDRQHRVAIGRQFDAKFCQG